MNELLNLGLYFPCPPLDSQLMPNLKGKHKTAGKRVVRARSGAPAAAAQAAVRLTSIRTEGELHEFLVEEVAALFGAQRVLVVLETPAGLRIAGSLLPRNEQPLPVLNAITPWLASARRSRSCRLRHGPAGAEPTAQRSCLIAPLVAQDELLGYLYADIEGDAGRFDETDRDLIGMLAAHAAVALDNAQQTQRLEHEVERCVAERDARAAELSLIDSIHRGIAARLDFQAIVDVVGDKLREVFRTGDASIHWIDPKLGLVRRLYTYEHDVRLNLPPFQRNLDDPVDKRLRSRQPLVLNTIAEAIAWGMGAVAGTDQARSIVRVPIYTGDRLLGSIGLKNHARENAFGEAEVHLLGTVAASMGVALENARLFDETQRLLKETEQRNAELAVINSIQQGMAGSLDFRGIIELVGDKLRTVFGSDNLSIPWWDQQSGMAQVLYAVQHGERVHPKPVKPDQNGPFMRALFANRPVLANSRAEIEAWGLHPPEGLAPSQATLTVPIFASDKLIGVITLDSHDPARRFSEDDQRLLQTVVATMGIALENARLFNETKEALHKVEERTAELSEALEYQTAISQVLRVISQSPTDVTPVLEVILDCATRLVQPQLASIFRYDGRLIHMAAKRNWTPEMTEEASALFPMPADERSIAGRAILARKTIAVEDLLSDPQYGLAHIAKAGRRIISVPMLKDDVPVGALSVAWSEPGQTPQRQINLLKTFADQAVIAIENVRLFNETQEALERQTATAEVLQVISKSVADAQPVFEKITQSCQRLFHGSQVGINLLRPDEMIDLAAYVGPGEVEFRTLYPVRMDNESGTGLAIKEQRVMHFPDALAGNDVPRAVRRGAELMGGRSVVFAPLVWEDRGIGAIFVSRSTVSPFSDHEISLLKTFADQAAIAIQNARLFNETKEALERQTATANVLKAISRSTFDLGAVLETLISTAARLCRASFGVIFKIEGDVCRAAGLFGATPALIEHLAAHPPLVSKQDALTSRAAATGHAVQVEDALTDPYGRPDVQQIGGYRTLLAIPILREGTAIGVLTLGRMEVRAFNDKEIELVTSFADQAAIAMENVRLFNETKEALEQQTATAEVLQVISSSVSDTAPVFDKILDSCRHLFAIEQLGIFLLGEDQMVHA
ncbi:MAG TPA: GAF domain-containing protein, partial [Burkholderiales bacterium]|nr:GAF domain-containing protein [Burkholderiales bacterium]